MPAEPANPLIPRALTPLPLTAVQPTGWLRHQLIVQARGLTGHLDEFWPDLGPRNMWLGGDLEGWERAPYYLDGLVPLAWLLDEDRLKAKAMRWLDAILGRQLEDGWIGPIQAPGRRAYDIWPVAIVLKVLTQYAEATGDPRAATAIERFCLWLESHLDDHPLFEWGHYRWADLVLSIDWLHDRSPAPWLRELSGRVFRQGYDWTNHFAHFQYLGKTDRAACTLSTHVVNSAMGIKSPGIWWRHSHSERDRDAVYQALECLDRYHGQVTGVFTGDEHYAGLDPTQGTELCAVVEYCFSLEQLLSTLGDPEFGDRLERIAYNAMPAAHTPDMWGHQYDQQVNQVLCTVAPRHWTNNDDTSNIFGLEPNYGCCTANLHQGWPKLASHLWMATPEGGLAAVVYAPCELTTRIDGTEVRIVEETEYPFRETVSLTIHSDRPVRIPFAFRVPAWTRGSTAEIEGDRVALDSGSFSRFDRVWQPGERIELRFPMNLRAETRWRGALSITRGPLVFALRVREEQKLIGGEPPHGDWQFTPKSPWNIALDVDHTDLGASIEVTEQPVSQVPFDTDRPPVILRAPARTVPEWRLVQNSAGPTPESPVEAMGEAFTVDLIPYGSTQLRIAEFPTTGAAG